MLAVGGGLPPFSRRAGAAVASSSAPGASPYGAIDGLAADTNGLVLPPGFTSRVVARAGQVMPGTGYTWHTDPDGGAVFPLPDGGWVYASNNEERIELTGGGAAALRFAPDGTVVDAYRILDGTYTNCAGGATPWGTWLSCEEHPFGQVWECDPTKPGNGVARPALGRFWHEAVAVDPVEGRLYMTEDAYNGQDGRFYRFTPTAYPDLGAGVLEAARLDGDSVTWIALDTTTPITPETAGDATQFKGAEGVWYQGGVVLFTTKTDNRLWRYDVAAQRLTVLYDAAALVAPPLKGVDNIVVSGADELFVAEDGGNMELVLVTPTGVVAPFLRVVGHDGSEIAGPAFDPSGTRLYFTSMRGAESTYSTDGFVYEVTGPFRRAAVNVESGGAATGGVGAAAGSSTTKVLPSVADRLPATGASRSPWAAVALLGAAAGVAAGVARS